MLPRRRTVGSYINDDTSSPEGYTDPWKPEYNSDPTTSITVKWDEGASNEEKLERIITQKWIANFPLSTEAWADYRRTGPYNPQVRRYRR